jgi:three-Cys-motif partner protein
LPVFHSGPVQAQLVETELGGAVAVGTAAGLLRNPDDKPQSFFKHALIEQYILPFVTMVGRWAPDNRVVVVDGYAGRGRYEDDTPGSGEILLQSAERTRSSDVDVFLIEKSRQDHSVLERVTAEYIARGVRGTALNGPVEAHLSAVLSAAQGLPLFLLLDPCGAVLPFDDLGSLLGTDRAGSRPPTEVMLNFSAHFTRRSAGALAKGQTDSDGVRKLDQTCGGEWWRAVALDAYERSHRRNFESAAEAVVNEYGRRLAERAGSGARAVTIPVRARTHHQPIYHLVFLTRRNHGIWVFGAALGKARQQWMKKLGPLEEDGDSVEGLFSVGDVLDEIIEHEEERSFTTVKQNVLELVQRISPTPPLVDVAEEVYRGCSGQVTEPTIRKAVRELESEGRITLPTPLPKQLRDWSITRRN